jgi:hypothetical protein
MIIEFFPLLPLSVPPCLCGIFFNILKTPERIIWTAAIGSALAAAYFMPASVLGMDLCLFKRLTSVECPFCGMTRSVHLAAHGDISSALTYNPMGVVLVLALLVMVPVIWRGGPGPATIKVFTMFLAAGFLAGWLLRLIIT